jgi:uncharacterized protein YbjT (DUF2867 family)
MNITVLGGSGFIGSHVCEKLAAAGHTLTVPTRRLEAAKHLLHIPRLTLLPCNVHDAAQLACVMSGHDAVVNLIAVLHGNAARFEQVHVTLAHRIVAACRAAGLARVVHVSALGAALNAPSMYQRSKAQGEAVLTGSGLDVSVLRPSVVFGAQDKLLNLFAALQRAAPLVPLAGADTQFQPVWVEDVAQAVVQLTQSKPGAAKVYEACGTQVVSLRELFAIAGRCADVQRPIVALPMPLARLQAWVMEHLPGAPLMSRDNLDSMRIANIASGQLPGLADLGIAPSSIYAIAPSYIGAPRTLDIYRQRAAGS